VVESHPQVERRRGEKIKAKGIYRDPVRSSHSHFVKASGLRWLRLMVLVTIPWAGAVWALPFLTVWTPSERYHQERRRQPKKLTEWARQMLGQVRRWLPQRELIVVADSSFAVLTLWHALRQLSQPVTMITRLRLDAALYEPAPARVSGQTGRPRSKGKRLPTLLPVLHDSTTSWAPLTVCGWDRTPQREGEVVSEIAVWYPSGMPPVPIRWVLIRDPLGKFTPQALLSTDVNRPPIPMVTWFVQR
jgi:hypothetical protein